MEVLGHRPPRAQAITRSDTLPISSHHLLNDCAIKYEGLRCYDASPSTFFKRSYAGDRIATLAFCSGRKHVLPIYFRYLAHSSGIFRPHRSFASSPKKTISSPRFRPPFALTPLCSRRYSAIFFFSFCFICAPAHFRNNRSPRATGTRRSFPRDFYRHGAISSIAFAPLRAIWAPLRGPARFPFPHSPSAARRSTRY